MNPIIYLYLSLKLDWLFWQNRRLMKRYCVLANENQRLNKSKATQGEGHE